MIRMRYCRAFLVVALTMLSGCLSSRPPAVLPPIAYPAGPPVRIDVARIDVVNDYVSPLSNPNVEYFAPTPPVNAIRRFIEERFVAIGSVGTMRVLIRDGSIKEVSLPRSSGLQGLVTQDETERYDGRLAVRIEVERNDTSASYDTSAERAKIVREGTTLADRERALNELTQSLIDDLTARIRDGLITTLAPYVAR